MSKFSLVTKKTVEYRVLVEAENVVEAQRILDDMVDEDFDDFVVGADWADGEWELVEESK